MKINLIPQRRDDSLEVEKSGDRLTVNGEVFDLSQVLDGDTLPREAIDSIWFSGPVDRIDGELILSMLLPIPWNYSQEQAFPVPLESVPDGPVVFPQPLNQEESMSKLAEQQTSFDSSDEVPNE